MVESEIDEYNLNSNEREQSLKISLINNQQISLLLINKVTEQKYTTLISLNKLKKLCKAFISSKTIKEALNIIKNTIEFGKISITEDPNNFLIEIEFKVSLASGDFPPFNIQLFLDETTNEKEDYGNIEKSDFEFPENLEETQYENFINNKTNNENYFDPKFQVFYPNQSIKTSSQRIQDINAKNPKNIDEYFLSNTKQMNKDRIIKNFSPIKEYSPNYYRTNSVSSSKANNNIKMVNHYINEVRSAMEYNETNIPKNNLKTNSIYNTASNDYNYINLNNNLNKTNSSYITMTYKPFLHGTKNFTIDEQNLFNKNLNKTNYYENNFSQSKNNNFNNIIKRRPKIVNRAQSTPSHSSDLYKFDSTQIPNIYQPSPTINQFQTSQFLEKNQFNNNNKFRYPYDRNTQRIINNNLSNISIPSTNDQNKNNFKDLSKMTFQVPHSIIQEKLSLIQRQQQKVQEVQQHLANIQQQFQIQQQQRKSLRNKNIQNSPKNQNSQEFIQIKLINKQFKNKSNQLREQIQIKPNLNPIKQNQSFNRNKNPSQIEKQSSHEIKLSKTQMVSQTTSFKTQISSPKPSQSISLNKEISQQQIDLAQMASMQNQENPNYQSLEAIVLPNLNQESNIEQNNQEIQENEEMQNISTQQEYLQETQQNKENNENDEIEQEEKLISSQPLDINIEALFITEEGRVIFRNGLLRGIIHKYSEIDDVVSKIQDILLKGVKFNLVYKAFDLDDEASTFHEKCDNLEMSLVLVETSKNIRFGGFTTKSWKGNCIKKIDNKSFVFSLESNKIFDVIYDEPAVGCYPKFGPVFFGCQIRIYDKFFKNGGTTCHKGLNFKTDIDYELNNGEQKYLIKDIEVYSLETIDIV